MIKLISLSVYFIIVYHFFILHYKFLVKSRLYSEKTVCADYCSLKDRRIKCKILSRTAHLYIFNIEKSARLVGEKR